MKIHFSWVDALVLFLIFLVSGLIIGWIWSVIITIVALILVLTGVLKTHKDTSIRK